MLSLNKIAVMKPQQPSPPLAHFRANLIIMLNEWPTFERICGEIVYDALQHFDFGTTIW
jgi:hypothetical protein